MRQKEMMLACVMVLCAVTAFGQRQHSAFTEAYQVDRPIYPLTGIDTYQDALTNSAWEPVYPAGSFIKLRVVTRDASAPWSDPNFLGSNPRYSGGALTVKVWRWRSTGAFSFCEAQTISVPAQPSTTVDAVLDATKFVPSDGVLFEDNNAFSVHVLNVSPSGAVLRDVIGMGGVSTAAHFQPVNDPYPCTNP